MASIAGLAMPKFRHEALTLQLLHTMFLQFGSPRCINADFRGRFADDKTAVQKLKKPVNSVFSPSKMS